MTEEKSTLVDYKKVLKEFLEIREWTDELEEDADEHSILLSTGIKCGDQGGRLIIKGYDQTGIVDVFIYFDQQCKESKIDQMAILLNGIHQRWSYGRLMVFSDGYIRWQHRVDFEGCNPTGSILGNIVQVGWDVASLYADTIISVAITKQTAKVALEEFDESQVSDDDESNEAPSEL